MSTTAWMTSWSVAVGAAVADELAVDLEVVERQVLEVVERAEAGAEVVEREAAAEVGETARRSAAARGMLATADRLGDLEDDLAGADLAASGARARSARAAPDRPPSGRRG